MQKDPRAERALRGLLSLCGDRRHIMTNILILLPDRIKIVWQAGQACASDSSLGNKPGVIRLV